MEASNEEGMIDGEVFEDADDQDTNGTTDFEMELWLRLVSHNSDDFEGAANTTFYRYCRQYVSLNKPAMLVIMETRCDPNKLRKTFNLLGYDNFSATEVQGYAGGIIVAWKKDDISVEVCIKSFQYMHLKVNYPNEANRNALWDELKVIASSMNEPWLLAGDFNDIMTADEKKGGAAASRRKCNIFRDRVLTRLEYSDHHPIIISPKEAPHPVAKRQFRFESAWLMEDTYTNMLRQSWNMNGNIKENLTNVERNVKGWKYQTIDEVMYKKKELTNRINGIQRCLQEGRANGGLRRMECNLQNQLSNILRKEELMWYQRSRAKWLMDGDRNTKYYHLKTVDRRRKNNILMLKDSNGQWVEDTAQLQQAANEFYMNSFSDDQLTRTWLNTEVTFPVLDTSIKEKMAAPVNEEEFKELSLICIRGRHRGRMDSQLGFIKSRGMLWVALSIVLWKMYGIIQVSLQIFA
ncbi:hypothetical protein A2U01_0003073 [Trifolium medium]|uniref:Endonuclease/exonuclease/phosphatase domain-containing protein n=1 Tax=Trifolium medium TaxID=97028 RepID=A0A392M4E8_9FABA|nr:hypothetical protein [Trifolium medium]